MSAAYEELDELLDERGIGYRTMDDQAVLGPSIGGHCG
jgi:hypothetical protein